MEQINLREIPNFFDFEKTVKNDGKLDISELTNNVNLKTNEIEKEYELKTAQLSDELNKDSSDKNQLRIIGNILYEFNKN